MLQVRGEVVEIGIGIRVQLQVVDQGGKCLPLFGIEILLGDVLAALVDNRADIVLARLLLTPERDDARLLGQLPGKVAMIQRRNQLARRQVAGATEDNEVKWINRAQVTLLNRKRILPSIRGIII